MSVYVWMGIESQNVEGEGGGLYFVEREGTGELKFLGKALSRGCHVRSFQSVVAFAPSIRSDVKCCLSAELGRRQVKLEN